jgi:exonuclease VII large subunit
MKRFAEDTKELTGATSWWEKIDRAEPDPKVEVKPETPKKSEKELRREVKRQIKEEKRKKKAKKRRRHSSSSSSDSEKEEAKKRKLEALRKERLERELAEQQRVRQLVREEKPISDAEKERRYTYSNQFNPDLVRRR